ncbi:PRC-barrel domain-containing protein [Microvirga aerilata]|uniref:PRC-barrel domain-containing protein n=1 Tax=Microvirga aerilata TaxID=670292 RepID=A0A936Z917_9HYPH|nr:PRC-barrel domain-containing protein [Microvirga aerilata]
MLKSYATACLMATALVAAPAWAQTSPAPAGQPAGGQAGAANIQFITESRPDMWPASQLEGVNVYNDRNENIGDINEVLIDRQGKVEAVVIGVGGFLGIGDRNVAVPFNALRWEMTEPNTASGGGAGSGAGGTGTGGAAGTTAGTGTAGSGGAGIGTAGTAAGMGAGGQAPAGATGTGTGAAGGTAAGGAGTGLAAGGAGAGGTAGAGGGAAADPSRSAPARAVLAGVTRDQLEQAPEFRAAR